MQIPSLFWAKFRALCLLHLGDEGAVAPQIERVLVPMPTAARPEQDRMMAALFSTLGRVPNAIERGFLIGTRMPVTAYGAASLGMLTAPTIGDTLQFIADIQYAAVPLLDFGYLANDSEGRLTIRFRCPIDREAEALIVAMCIAAIECELARRSGRIGNFSRLELTASSRGAETSYRNWLGRMPSTDAAANTLVFTRAVLDLPNIYADRDSFDSIQRAASKWARPRECGVALQDRVQDLIRANIANPPSLAQMAKALNLTPRQFRQCLQRERTSYQAIIRASRIECTSALLPNTSLSQIAERLGYSDLSAFSHAFFRWTGRTPSAYRSELLSRGSESEDGR